MSEQNGKDPHKIRLKIELFRTQEEMEVIHKMMRHVVRSNNEGAVLLMIHSTGELEWVSKNVPTENVPRLLIKCGEELAKAQNKDNN